MRKVIIYGILIFLFSIFTGYIYSIMWKEKEGSDTVLYANQTLENAIKTTSVEPEEKISYNAKFCLKKHYKDCGHTKIENGELPIEFVNLSKEEIELNYEDWTVEEFNKSEVILSKDINGFCEEHFIIRLKDDGLVEVYGIDLNGDEVLINKTEISENYLTSDDILKLKEGVAVYGMAELNSVLEDFE